ncbi:roadblock/LC7 domain-containing protein [Kitasatospora sp. NPDC058218]|uniref:roadblock/LC7 domain-containing protein n=1 Tax=Kitasatospora sp. NPDC058218 TaxID=3346385 RepID=UPI0036D7BDBA
MQPHPQPPFLSDLVTGTSGAVAAIQVSPEGLVTGTSPGISRDDADKWAALMAALGAVSARSVDVAGELTSGGFPWGHSVIEDRFGQTLTLVGAPDQSMLAVVGEKGADLGEIVGRMIELADQGLPAPVAV